MDKFLRLLTICNDVSLDWLFYGTGSMFREDYGVQPINIGSFSGVQLRPEDLRVNKPLSEDDGFVDLAAMLVLVSRKDDLIETKDRIIKEKDIMISQRDEVIGNLYEQLGKSSKRSR